MNNRRSGPPTLSDRPPTAPPERTLRSIIEHALDHPALFYAVRFLLVGRQTSTRQRLHALLGAGADDTVLDVCCGIGEFAGCVDGRYLGIDVNARFIARARQAHGPAPAKRFQVADATRLPFPDGHFDRALAVNCLHHFSDEMAEQVLREIRRVTRTLVLVVDIDGTPRGVVRRSLLAMDRGAFIRTPAQLTALVRCVFDVDERECWDVGFYTEVAFRCLLPSTVPAGR